MVMTKVPGVTLASPGDGLHSLSEDEYAKVSDAFKIAVSSIIPTCLSGCPADHYRTHRALSEAEVDNGSHHLGNVVWDKEEEKCYIIDFERATVGKVWGLATNLDDWASMLGCLFRRGGQT